MKTIEQRYKFFFDELYAEDDNAAITAMDLARAEHRAETLGLVCSYEPDEVIPWDEEDGTPLAQLVVWRAEDVQWELKMFSVKHGARCLAVMGGIRRDSPREHVRVLTAEVYQLALEALDAEVQAAADELAGRATYASGG